MKKKVQARIMTPSERESLSASIASDEAYRDAVASGDTPPGMAVPVSDLGVKNVDMDAIDRSIAHRKRILSEGTPERVSGAAREKAEKRYEELKHVLAERLLTHREQDLMPKAGYDYHKAVRKSMAFEVGNPETQKFMEEYRSLGAQLDPDNPEAQSIDALRKPS